MDTDRLAKDLEALVATVPRQVAPIDQIVGRAYAKRRRRGIALLVGASLASTLTITVIIGSTGLSEENATDPMSVVLPPCPRMESYEDLRSQPKDLPGGADSAQLCPTFFWKMDRAGGERAGSIEHLIETIRSAMDSGPPSGVGCTMLRIPTYLILLGYPSGETRVVHASLSPSECDFLRVGTRFVQTGGNDVMAAFDSLASK